MSPLVYDVGMNNGDDSHYYLAKGYSVIGIEADPELARSCRERFASEIACGKMNVLNIGVGLAEGHFKFYVNRRLNTLSTFSHRELDSGEWDVEHVEMKRLSSVIREFGDPLYIKIDVEHYDHLVLFDLYNNSIRPPYISAEAHCIDTYCALVMMGYEEFALVQGESVPFRYGKHTIRRVDGSPAPYEFRLHSSGPFGDDLDVSWVNKMSLLKQLLNYGLGWIDIHARRLPEGEGGFDRICLSGSEKRSRYI
jgi:FkbM family methyltransferase